MHEIGLIQDAIEHALKHAEQSGAQRIDSVTIRLGDESGVDPEVIAAVFPMLTQRTLAEQAQLVIERVPVICCCPVCAEEFHPADALHSCPRCRRPGAPVRCGREFALASLEVS